MLGLVVLFVIGAYLIFSLLVVWLSARWAKKRGRRGWVWGGIAAFAMYNLVFWDLIPTLVMHKYYCSTEAGFWVYKAPEQWVKENPGVRETLSMSHLPEHLHMDTPQLKYRHYGLSGIFYLLPDETVLIARYDTRGRLRNVEFKRPDGTSGYQLNERIRHVDKTDKSFTLSIRRHNMELIDVGKRETLAKYVNFSWGHGNPLLGTSGSVGAIGTKFFSGGNDCDVKPQKFMDYVNLFRDKGELQ